ncbi:MAG TPA: TlpA disulfide reductase family protein [Sphaerochaeta sp.]|jgi:thiol-disulfide isomerase/thioredoxin|nr:TlpA family protein disulfide reductase [Spirochaetales bacterium]HPX28091.1 TlpA disulfide reductase family protein [Sphaerochaeta sp.]HQB54579.1 TlpA disulfide reductase family protein [Sphaerochaeta sp.]
MKKQTRNLLIAIMAFILIIVLASVLYNKLVDDTAPTVSYTPVLRDLPPSESAMSVAMPVNEDVATDISEDEESAPTTEETVAETEKESDELKMPNIPLYRLDGSETDFYEVADGKPVVLNYFASWCPPCQAEMPDFVKAFNTYEDRVTFIFLDALDGERESLATLRTFIKKQEMDESSVFYDEGIFSYIFQTTSLPTTVFFYGDGAIAGGQLGMVNEQYLKLAIDEITSEASRNSR